METIEEQANDKDGERNKSLMRNKINESIDNVMRIKSGVELIDIVKSIKPAANILERTNDGSDINVSNGKQQMMKTQQSYNTARNKGAATKTEGAGLPIFSNTNYKKHLQKLLSSKDLDECYDYDNND